MLRKLCFVSCLTRRLAKYGSFLISFPDLEENHKQTQSLFCLSGWVAMGPISAGWEWEGSLSSVWGFSYASLCNPTPLFPSGRLWSCLLLGFCCIRGRGSPRRVHLYLTEMYTCFSIMKGYRWCTFLSKGLDSIYIPKLGTVCYSLAFLFCQCIYTTWSLLTLRMRHQLVCVFSDWQKAFQARENLSFI